MNSNYFLLYVAQEAAARECGYGAAPPQGVPKKFLDKPVIMVIIIILET
jgi:hypothetical protein